MTRLLVVPSHPEYSVTDSGQVWSVKSQKFLSLIKGKLGSWRVNLSSGGVRVNAVGVHRLVCEAFHGPAPEGKPWALHKNGNASDNRPENLYWGNPQENVDDMMRHGTHVSQAKTHCPNQHLYEGENLYIYPNGDRGCRTCHRDEMRRRIRLGLEDRPDLHGTNTGYANWGCRCPKCREARRKYNESRRQRRSG